MVTSAKYVKSENKNSDNENTSIKATIGGQKWSVPLDPSNRHYQAIQEWVAEGNKIEEAD
tara:strand:- start:257 stop:436 length:180 start_codon:yes stop_codon:yes gene_type:complete